MDKKVVPNGQEAIRTTKDKSKTYNNGKYEQVMTLGNGAFAEVVACKFVSEPILNKKRSFLESLITQTKPIVAPGELVAIKKFKNQPMDLNQQNNGLEIDSIREIKFLQKLTHPNIVQVLELFLETKTSELSKTQMNYGHGNHGPHQGNHSAHKGMHGGHQGSHDTHQGSHGAHQGTHNAHQGTHNAHQGTHSSHQGTHSSHQVSHGGHQGSNSSHQGSHSSSHKGSHGGAHENLPMVNLIKRQSSGGQEEKKTKLMLVMPLCLPFLDLKGYAVDQFGESEFRWIFKQILLGMEYMHQNYVLHRDIKIDNLLVDKNCNILITDFGLSRQYGEIERRLTSGVYTINYRPPEIILGSMVYGPKSDMWAVGVVFAEILLRMQKNLFPMSPNDDEICLLQKIFALRGTPTKDTWKDFDKLPIQMTFTASDGVSLHEIDQFSEYSKDLMGIIDHLLKVNPNSRPTASELLELPYFKETLEPTGKYTEIISKRLVAHRNKILNNS